MHFSYEFEMQTLAFQSSAIASFLRYTSELAPLHLRRADKLVYKWIKSMPSSLLRWGLFIWQIARNNLNKFSNADYAKRSQSVFANLNI